MANKHLHIIALLISLNSFSQSIFNNHYDYDSLYNGSFAVAVTNDGNYIVSDWDWDFFINVDTIIIRKMNCLGDITLIKKFDFSIGADLVYSIKSFNDTDILFCGGTKDTANDNSEMYLAKLDGMGNLIWVKFYGVVNGYDQAWEVIQTYDGGLALIGYSGITDSAGNNYPGDIHLFKLDFSGNIIWDKFYGGIYNDKVFTQGCLKQTKDSGYIIAGTKTVGWVAPYWDYDTYVIKTDSAGNIQWDTTYGVYGKSDEAQEVELTMDGGYIVCGSGGMYSSGYIMKLDSAGNQEWLKYYHEPSNDALAAIKQLPDGSYIAAGSIYMDSNLEWDGWLMKVDANGDSLWSKTFGNPTMAVGDYFYDMQLTSDGGFVCAGQYNRIGSPYQDMWLVKVDSNGCVDSATCNYDCIACDFIVPKISAGTDTVFVEDSMLIQFYDSSAIGRSRVWYFGDGATSTDKNPTHKYDSVGTYTVMLVAEYGICIDTAVKPITVSEHLLVMDSVSTAICSGDSIFLGGSWQKMDGSFIDTIIMPFGADTVKITTLNIVSIYSVDEGIVSICSGDSLLIYGSYRKTVGVYYDSLQSMNGCDSVLYTSLVIDPVYFINQGNVSICSGDSIFLGGSWQKAGGSYSDTFTTVNGCDSIIETVLTEYPAYNVPATAVICSGDSILLQGSYQTNAGTYYDNLTIMSGCDSIIETTLTIDPLPVIDSITIVHASGANDSDGTAMIYVSSGTPPYTFIWSNGQTATGSWQSAINNIKPDTYMVCITDTNGCAPMQGCGSAVVSFVVGEAPLSPPEGGRWVSIYPNPNDGRFTLSTNNEYFTNERITNNESIMNKSNYQIRIMNIFGQEVTGHGRDDLQGRLHWEAGKNTVAIDISKEPGGVYFVEVMGAGQDGISMVGKVIIVK